MSSKTLVSATPSALMRALSSPKTGPFVKLSCYNTDSFTLEERNRSEGQQRSAQNIPTAGRLCLRFVPRLHVIIKRKACLLYREYDLWDAFPQEWRQRRQNASYVARGLMLSNASQPLPGTDYMICIPYIVVCRIPFDVFFSHVSHPTLG